MATNTRSAVKGNALSQPENNHYQPRYRESSYRRSLFWRLTPLTRFILALLLLAVLAGIGLLINRSLDMRNGMEMLSERMKSTAQAMTPVVVILVSPQPPEQGASAAAHKTKPEPTATPLPDLSRAPWADKLVRQLDGKLLAPKEVVAQASNDVLAYYTLLRDMPVDTYIARRDEILTTYFTGAALADMRKLEEERDIYAMNRTGRVTVEVRDFSADGLSAKAGVITRDWVSDVYDVTSRQLVAKGRIKKDSLTIMTILFDQASGHWKIAAIEETTEIQP
jgi:hypothetical protein